MRKKKSRNWDVAQMGYRAVEMSRRWDVALEKSRANGISPVVGGAKISNLGGGVSINDRKELILCLQYV